MTGIARAWEHGTAGGYGWATVLFSQKAIYNLYLTIDLVPNGWKLQLPKPVFLKNNVMFFIRLSRKFYSDILATSLWFLPVIYCV